MAATRYRAPRGAHLAVLDEQRRDQPPPLAGAEARVRAGGPSRCGAHHRHSCSPATRPRGFLAAWLAVADRLGLGSLLASVRTAFVHGMDLALLFLPGRATVRHEAGRQRVAVS